MTCKNIKYEKPTDLLKNTESTMEGLSMVELFNSPQYQKLREQWCAGIFGVGYQTYVCDCKVSVNTTNNRLDADFFLQTDNSEWPFQLAEVQEPGRKRSAEYKGFDDGSIKSIPYRPGKGHIEGPKWLKEGIEKKVKKNYANSKNLNLVIYANFVARQIDYTILKNAVTEFKDHFSSIWIITSTHICSIYSNPTLGEIAGWGEVRTISDYQK